MNCGNDDLDWLGKSLGNMLNKQISFPLCKISLIALRSVRHKMLSYTCNCFYNKNGDGPVCY